MNKIPTTVEAQIRTRARNLPIYQCYINRDWEASQRANMMIVRKHTNGNISLGNFLVDLKLFGVRECNYKFNQSPLLLEQILKKFDDYWMECEYQLAHNIIYAGLEFAEDYGFAPHKNFKTAQYLLEKDTDDIPVIDVPLGDNGVPLLEIPYGETGQHEISILNKTAGADYRVVYLDKDGKPEPDEHTYMEIYNEMLEKGLDNYERKRPNEPDAPDSIRETQAIFDLIYFSKVYTTEEKEQIFREFEHITNDPRLVMANDDNVNDYEQELDLSVKYFIDGNTEKASAEIRKVIDCHSDDPILWDIFLYNLSVDSEKVDEEVVKEAYSLYPNHPVIKAWYTEWLAQEDRTDEIFTLLNNIPGLDALTTENRPVSIHALTSFCFAYAMAWLRKNDITRAEPYYQIIIRLGLDNRIGKNIQEKMTNLKREKVQEMSDAGRFE